MAMVSQSSMQSRGEIPPNIPDPGSPMLGDAEGRGVPDVMHAMYALHRIIPASVAGCASGAEWGGAPLLIISPSPGTPDAPEPAASRSACHPVPC